MGFPKHTINVPIEIAGLDCIAEVRITGYVQGAGPVLYGDYPDPGWPDEVEFCVEGIRVDGDFRCNSAEVSKGLDSILSASDQLREACLDAIADYNQPHEI